MMKEVDCMPEHHAFVGVFVKTDCKPGCVCRVLEGNGIVKLFLALLLILPITVSAENEKEILRLEKSLMRVQQEAQTVHQQFLMIQELRRNEIQGSPLADFPGATVQSKPIPKYEEMMQRQQEKKDRVEQLGTELDRLYLQFNELNDERQSLMEQIRRLEHQPVE